MKKSLLPLIVVLTAVVILTAMLINTRPAMSLRQRQGETDQKPKSAIDFGSRGSASGTMKHKEFAMDKETIFRMLYQAYGELGKGGIDAAEDKVKTILVFQPENMEALSFWVKFIICGMIIKTPNLFFVSRSGLIKNPPALIIISARHCLNSIRGHRRLPSSLLPVSLTPIPV
ncbi:MAG: hypothetical protein PHV59_02290 [Victivallales bacterium]|nr:hypothetical protein [Victivallales bacterium]